jgi:hypothetical protein
VSKHSRQNQFHGSTGRPAPPRGGVANVTARDTIGAYECWCQGAACWTDEAGVHMWAGREQGEPHPSPQEIEEIEMVVMMEALDRSDVKNYPNKVQDLLLTLVNECGIRCRVITGTEMLLYPPDGRSRPFKVMSRRGEKQSLGFLHRQFIAAYDVHLPEKKKEQPVGEPTITFTEAKPEPKPAPPKVANPFNPALHEEEVSVTETEIEPQVVWRRAIHSKTDEPMDNWETDGSRFRCVLCFQSGKEVIFESGLSLGGHTRSVHRDVHPIHMPGALAKRSETVARKKVEKKITAAIALLQDAAGITTDASEVEALKKKVETLTADLDREKHRADDAEARLALLREALNA